MDALCHCHCATRVSLDEHLLQQREEWREKYLCLQKQAGNDLARLKENIYAECAALMQEFSAREAQHNAIVNAKNAENQQLVSRVIQLEAKLKVAEKENEVKASAVRDQEGTISELQSSVGSLRSQLSQRERQWEARLEDETGQLRKTLAEAREREVEQKEGENQHLKHKIKDYEKKYQAIIPEVEKLKKLADERGQQVEQLQDTLERVRRRAEEAQAKASCELQEAKAAAAKHRAAVGKLSQRKEELERELEAAGRAKREVRVEPVYIDRPVEVERVVERVVEVEKVVTKHIEPTTFRDEQLEQEVKTLQLEIERLVREVHEAEQEQALSQKEYEEALSQYEANEQEYRRERRGLLERISEQEKELSTVQTYIERVKHEARAQAEEPEKIKILVNKDGTFQKKTERAGNPAPQTGGRTVAPKATSARRK